MTSVARSIPWTQTVPADWALIPDGIEPGDSFRLLFVTSATRDASDADVADYEAHVQASDRGSASLNPFKDRERNPLAEGAPPGGRRGRSTRRQHRGGTATGDPRWPASRGGLASSGVRVSGTAK